MAVRAILGQQVSVKGASTLAGRVAAEFGSPERRRNRRCYFPCAATLAGADLTRVGVDRPAGADPFANWPSAVAGGEVLASTAHSIAEAIRAADHATPGNRAMDRAIYRDAAGRAGCVSGGRPVSAGCRGGTRKRGGRGEPTRPCTWKTIIWKGRRTMNYCYLEYSRSGRC